MQPHTFQSQATAPGTPFRPTDLRRAVLPRADGPRSVFALALGLALGAGLWAPICSAASGALGSEAQPFSGPLARSDEPAHGLQADSARDPFELGLARLKNGDIGGALADWDRLLAPVALGAAAHLKTAEQRRWAAQLDRLGAEGRLPFLLILPEDCADRAASEAALSEGLARLGSLGPAARLIARHQLWSWARTEFEREALLRLLGQQLNANSTAVRLATCQVIPLAGPLAEAEALKSRLGPAALQQAEGSRSGGFRRSTGGAPQTGATSDNAGQAHGATAETAQRPVELELGLALARRCLVDQQEGVRQAAAVALGQLGENLWSLPLEQALGAHDWTLRSHAAEALARSNLPAAEGALWLALARPATAASGDADYGGSSASIFIGSQQAYVSDYDVEVATGQSIADPQIDVLFEGASLWVSVCHVESRQDAYQRNLRAALASLTGRAISPGISRAQAQARYDAWSQRQGTPSSGSGKSTGT